jgi:hypothetical protein
VFLHRIVYLLCLIATFSFSAIRECTSDEKKSAGCNLASHGNISYMCIIDAEEDKFSSSKNIPHCIKKYNRTWSIYTTSFLDGNADTGGIADNGYYVYVPRNGVKSDLVGALDNNDKNDIAIRKVNGKNVTRVNGDMAVIGATIMLPNSSYYGDGYKFAPSIDSLRSSIIKKTFINNANFPASSSKICQTSFIYDPNDTSYCQNSEQSTFDFSEKGTFIQNNLKGENIVYARLYWAGSITQNWTVSYNALDNGINFYSNAMQFLKGYSQIDFKVPGKSQVITIDAKPEDMRWFGSFSEYRPKSMSYSAFMANLSDPQQIAVKAGITYIYTASADVTKEVKESFGASVQSRTFAAGNIRATSVDPRKDFISINDAEAVVNENYNLKISDFPSFMRTGSLLYFLGGNDGGYWDQYSPSQYAGWTLLIIYNFDDKTAQKENIDAKLVTIYDGLKMLAPEPIKDGSSTTAKYDSVELSFDDVYTPKSGNIDATFTIFALGSNREVSSEKIQIQKANEPFHDNDDSDTVYNVENPSNNQFNSSMTKFGSLMNAGRIYNNQLDLDVFNISNFTYNSQKSLKMKITVANKKHTDQYGKNTTTSENINLALVAFSNRIYRPHTCYVEDISYKKPNEKKFTPLTKNSSISKSLPKGTILKTILKVKNPTNETVTDFALRAKISSSQIYQENTSAAIIVTTNSSFSKRNALYQKFNDNDGLQKVSGDTLTFFLGDGARANIGGKLEANGAKNAYAVFETKLESNFIENSYKAAIANLNLDIEPYEIDMQKCDPYSYNIQMEEDEPNDFLPSTNQDDGSGRNKNRLFTQIIGKPFNVYITNYGKDGSKKEPNSLVGDVRVELVKSCNDDTNLYVGDDKNLYKKDIKFKGVSEVLLKDVKVDKAYKSLKFRISHIRASQATPATQTKIVACENLDDFAVRPSYFSVYDTELNSVIKNNLELIGGKSYTKYKLVALTNADEVTKGYINTIDGINNIDEVAGLRPDSWSGCDASGLLSENRLKVVFDNENKAIGNIFRLNSSGVEEPFSFSDIGNAYFEIKDASFTKNDKHISPRADDCVRDRSENDPSKDPESEGRIGCDITIKQENNVLFEFNPKDLEISNLKIIADDNVTYLDSSYSQKVKVTFDVTARLFHDDIAIFYKDGCYANITSFDIKLDQVPLNYTDNDGNAGTLVKANDEILFFQASFSKTKKRIGASATKGMFYVEKSAFKDGKAVAELYFNFTRKTNHAKNPFIVTSDDFGFKSLSDGNLGSVPYVKPAQKTSAKFYYGRVYAPYYEGLYLGFLAKIYYGAYCNGCDKNEYMKGLTDKEAWYEFPSAPLWFINPHHKASMLTFADFSFTNKASKTILANNVSAVQDGVQTISVSNPKAVTDIVKMHAREWLIYNEFDKDATTNDFTVKFLVPNGNWAGKTLKSGSNEGDVGNVIGGENNFNDLSNKTNRRISW